MFASWRSGLAARPLDSGQASANARPRRDLCAEPGGGGPEGGRASRSCRSCDTPSGKENSMPVPLLLSVLTLLPPLSGGPGDPPCCSWLTAPVVPSDDPGYVLHEWGTFTTLAGSDGVLLEGLTYDDHQLPDFVYQRATSPAGFAGVRCKMETPVLYFYSDRARELRVKVGFQQGLLTQWYPQVRELQPPAGKDAQPLRGGLLDWGKIQVLAPGEGLERLP